jgi:hypothetical protein
MDKSMAAIVPLFEKNARFVSFRPSLAAPSPKTKNAADPMVSGVFEIPLGKSAYAASAPFA